MSEFCNVYDEGRSRHVQRQNAINPTNHDAELGEKDSERTLCMHKIAWAPRVQPLSIGTA